MWSDWLVFCEYGFSLSALWCPLATLTVLFGFLLPWTWVISSRLLQQSAAAVPYLGGGVSPHCQPSWPWTWSSSFRPRYFKYHFLETTTILFLKLLVWTTFPSFPVFPFILSFSCRNCSKFPESKILSSTGWVRSKLKFQVDFLGFLSFFSATLKACLHDQSANYILTTPVIVY